MNRLISLFALVAVAFAEPDAQYLTYGAPLVYAHHGNAHATAGLVQHPSGAVTPDDTASVKAAKVQHHAAKVNEYLKKPFVYAAATPVVAAQPVVYSKPAVTYTHQVAAPVTYTHQVAAPVTYTHHLLKREAESDSQYLYNSAYTYPYAAATTYGAYAGYPYTTYGAYAGYPYTTYAGYHHLYKRDAEADSQYFYNSAYTYPYASTYGAYAGYPYSTYAGVYGGAYRYGYPYVY